MAKDSLTVEFNATNVVFDKEQAQDVESNLNPVEGPSVVDAPVTLTPKQIVENPDLQKYVVPHVVVEDVPVYEPKEGESRRPLTGNECQHQKTEELDLNHAKKEDGAKNIGRIATGQDQNLPGSATKTDKENKKFNELMERLRDHCKWLLDVMNKIQDDIDALTAKIEECGRVIEALEDFKNGKIALGEDGYPDNERARKAIKDWERKNGKKWEPCTEEGMAALDVIILGEKIKRDGYDDHGGYIGEREQKQETWNKYNEEWHATENTISKFSQDNYVVHANRGDMQDYIDRLDKLRELEELRQRQEQQENENHVAEASQNKISDADMENAVASATDIFNSAPGLN